MNIILIFTKILNDFNEIFKNNLNAFTLESKIRECGDLFTIKLYEEFLNYLDKQFKKSNERKIKYNIKQTRKRSLITSFGFITFDYTSYIDKETGEYFVPLREILYLNSYQRLTNEAEYQLVKYSMDENMSQAAKHALRNTEISRSTVSKKIKVLDPFHYLRKHLKYIFKDDTNLRNIADNYIRNDLLDDFKALVKNQIKKYPD